MCPRGDFSLKCHVGLTYVNYMSQVMVKGCPSGKIISWKSFPLTKVGYYCVAYSLPKSNNFFLTKSNHNGFSCIWSGWLQQLKSHLKGTSAKRKPVKTIPSIKRHQKEQLSQMRSCCDRRGHSLLLSSPFCIFFSLTYFYFLFEWGWLCFALKTPFPHSLIGFARVKVHSAHTPQN